MTHTDADFIRLRDFPDLGSVGSDTRLIAERPAGAGSGYHAIQALESYLGAARSGVPVKGAIGDGVADDTAAIQSAIAEAAAAGADVLLDAKRYLITSTLNVGNGSTAAVSSYGGVRLLGRGQPLLPPQFLAGYPVASNRCTSLVWGGAQGGTMVSIRGPLQGWGLHNIFLDGSGGSEDFGGKAGRGLEVWSGQNGDCQNLTFRGCREASIYSATVLPPPGVLNSDSLHNRYRNINIATAWANGVKGIVLAGAGVPGPNTDFNDFSNIAISLPTSPASAASAYGLYLQACDSNHVSNLHLFNGHTNCLGVVFDYTVHPDWPAGNTIFAADWGGLTAPVQNAGTPSAAARPNVVYGVSETNGGFMPAGIANVRTETGAVGSVDLVGQTAALSGTLVPGTSRSGLYRVSYYLVVTGGGANGGNLSVSFTWLDGVGSHGHTSAIALNGPGNFVGSSLVCSVAQFGTILWGVNASGIGGAVTTQYKVQIAAERVF